MPNILVVDDELSMREFLKILLEKEGHSAIMAEDAPSAINMIQKEKFDLIISDIKMPGMGGLSLLEHTRKKNNHMPFIMMTAYASPEDAVRAMKGGAFDYITKPFKVEEIKNIIKTALSASTSQVTDTAQIAKSFNGIIGSSSEMLQIFDLIKRIAPTHANVLIYGESGTGKELVAQAVHRNSKVSDKPFVPIICSAIPESLFESELFGHTKGSFTGATANKTGLFAMADNGSIFLDEIGELSPLIQTKLLRVIQEREFKPVGGMESIKVNVRIISATNKDLEQEVMADKFREDLFYRLAVVPIRVPPLRERKDDIPLLVDHFLKKYSNSFDKEVTGLSTYAMDVLMKYDFPGNVRELENIIERGVAMENSNIILPESLTLAAHRKGQQNQQAEFSDSTLPFGEIAEKGLEEVIAELEKKLITKALEKADFSKMRAAEILKISFRSLRYKIQKYNITY